MSRFIERSVGNLFVQVDPADPFQYLTCTGVGDITLPQRAKTTRHEPDPLSSGSFRPAGFINGEQSPITTSLNRPLSTVTNFLLETECAFQARINWPCRGDRTIIGNYDVAAVLYNSEFTTGTIVNPAIIEPGEDDRIETNAELSALTWSFIYQLLGVEQDNPGPATANARSIAIVPRQCAGRCGGEIRLGEIAYVGSDPTAVPDDNMLTTANFGADWAYTVGDAFVIPVMVGAMLIVERSTDYRIVAGGQVAATAAATAYSDDAGATWTTALMGATVGELVTGLTRDHRGRVWACTEDVVGGAGSIYRSDDNGETWEAVVHTVAAQHLRSIVFYDENVGYAVGDADTFERTLDGGVVWTSEVGPDPGGADALLCVTVNHAGHVFVGNDDGELQRSIDQGDNWDAAPVLNPAASTGSLNDVEFDPDMRYFGYAAFDTAGNVGHLYRSEDGGVTWVLQETPANLGLTALGICDANTCYAVGLVDATPDTCIIKFERAV